MDGYVRIGAGRDVKGEQWEGGRLLVHARQICREEV